MVVSQCIITYCVQLLQLLWSFANIDFKDHEAYRRVLKPLSWLSIKASRQIPCCSCQYKPASHSVNISKYFAAQYIFYNQGKGRPWPAISALKTIFAAPSSILTTIVINHKQRSFHYRMVQVIKSSYLKPSIQRSCLALQTLLLVMLVCVKITGQELQLRP